MKTTPIRSIVLLLFACQTLVLADNTVFKQENITLMQVPQELRMNYAKEYIINGAGKYDANVRNIVLKDEFFKLANEYLNDDRKFEYLRSGSMIKPTGASTGIQLNSDTKIPNYKKALEYLARSIKEYSNPVSAYEFRYILKSMYGNNINAEYKTALKEAARLLYEHDVCEAVLDYGRMLEDAGKDADALEIYKVGTQKCRNNQWVVNVIAGRQSYIEKLKPAKEAIKK